jgi:hypothetical protein
MRRIVLSIVLLAVTLSGRRAEAADAVTLKWKLKTGDTFYLENVQKMKQTITVMGREVKQSTTQTAFTQFSVKKELPDGGAVIEQTILKISNPENKPGSAGAKISENMKGVKFTITLNSKHNVVKFEGYDDTDGNKAVAMALRSMMSKETMQKTASEAFSQLPGKSVSTGDMWNRSNNLSMGPIGNMAVTAIYEYVGNAKVDGKPVERITYVAVVKYSPPKADENSNLPFTIAKGDLKSDSFSGTIHFDPKSGRSVDSVTQMKISGDLTYLIQGKTRVVSLKQNMKIEVRVLDKNPLDK